MIDYLFGENKEYATKEYATLAELARDLENCGQVPPEQMEEYHKTTINKVKTKHLTKEAKNEVDK